MEADVKKALGALRMAIRVEQNGYRFYRRAAEETDDLQGRALFERLAEDEVAHESIIRTRLKALEGEGTWMAVSDDEWPDESPFAEGEPIFSRERLEAEVHDYTSELTALRMAYLIENSAVAFYTKAARETNDPIGRAMYEDLAGWEKAHQRILEPEYRFLANRFKLDMGFAPF